MVLAIVSSVTHTYLLVSFCTKVPSISLPFSHFDIIADKAGCSLRVGAKHKLRPNLLFL